VSELAQAWLASIPELVGTRLTRCLANGFSSQKWLYSGGGRQYVVCIDKPVAAGLKLDREAEFSLLQSIADEALGPRPVACAPGFLVTAYLPGRAWAAADFGAEESLRALAELLGRLHVERCIGSESPPLAAKLRDYALCSGDAGTAAEALHLLAGAAPEPDVVCHRDPGPGNIIGAAPAQLIDWEYAAPGNRYFDLAAVLEQQPLDAAAEACFLEYYVKYRPVDHAEIQRWRQIYRHTCSLWSRAVAAMESPEGPRNPAL
jgi:aminoglycoside phosphotransferase (APT) family kinase protein